MLELFTVGGVAFYILLIISTIIMFVFVEEELAAGATFTMLVSLLLLDLCGNIPVFNYTLHHPWVIIPTILSYLLLGTCWSVVKWLFYVRRERERYDEAKLDFIKQKNLNISVTDPIPDDLKEKWKENLKSRYGSQSIDINPQISKHKSRD
jgi:hypothetical protein